MWIRIQDALYSAKNVLGIKKTECVVEETTHGILVKDVSSLTAIHWFEDEEARNLAFEMLSARLLGKTTDDTLHPKGRCRCFGDGECAWCRTSGASERWTKKRVAQEDLLRADPERFRRLFGERDVATEGHGCDALCGCSIYDHKED